MIDKINELMAILNEVKEICGKHRDNEPKCSGCPFRNEALGCVIGFASDYMSISCPHNWDLSEIESTLKGY